MFLKRLVFLIFCIETICLCTPACGELRDFSFTLPLFSSDSQWNRHVTDATVATESDQQILTLYRVLRGDTTGFQPTTTTPATTWPFMDINYDDFSISIFAMGGSVQNVLVSDYEGNASGNTPKVPTGQDGTIQVPTPTGIIRPAGPQDTDADGHMVLFNSQTGEAYDFWQVTTVQDTRGNSLGGGQAGDAILAMGAVDHFSTYGTGVNPDGMSSARATGVPLLAGLIIPEDIERGSIDHALSFAIPFPRNLNAIDPFSPLSSDYFLPASTTETDYYSTNPNALAAGQRLRLKSSLVGEDGQPIDESGLSPITLMFLKALRTYGGIVVDNAGGFSFYAEDIHTGSLRLTNDQVNQMIGNPTAAPLPPGKSKWQVILEKLAWELEEIPLAYGPWTAAQDPTTATITMANFEVVSPASSESIPVEDSGYHVTPGLWAKAVLHTPSNPVNLVWKTVGSDTTPSGDSVISGYFYADPDDFAYGSIYNPEVFVKVYIASSGWANIAFNHVTVDDVMVYSAQQYSGSADITGSITLSNRLTEHQYEGVSHSDALDVPR